MPVTRGRQSAPDAGQQAFSPRFTFLSLALIMVIGLLVYANTFNAPFEFDDGPNILGNPFIRVTRISPDELRKVFQGYFANRPAASLTFALNYYFHQYDETGYHLVNVAIHLVTAFFVFLIALLTLSLIQSENTWMALPAALLWLVNPVHTQSVTYIVQRMNALAAMFYLLAMVCYVQGRLIQRRHARRSFSAVFFYGACLLAGLLGLASKEIAATLPAMIFLYEWYFFQNLDRSWLKAKLPWITGMLIVPAATAVIYFHGNPLTAIAGGYRTAGFTPLQRLLTEPGVIVYYLSLLFYPSPDRLRIIYDITPAASLFSPAAVPLSLAALAALLSAVFFLRHKNRLASFALIWFLGTLTVESTIIPLALAYEHRTYLPSVFLFVALTALFFQKASAQRALASLIALMLLGGIWTWQRNAVWKDKLTFWTDAVMKTPGDARTHNNLGLTHRERGDLKTALTHFKAALEQDDAFEKAYNNIGSALADLGRPAEALPYLEKAVALKMDYEDAHFNLGVALENLNRKKEAERCYRKTLELAPLYEKAHINFGIILMNRGEKDQAMAHFQQALAINPGFEKAYNNMGIACFRKGETDRAMEYFRKALTLNPDFPDAAVNLNRAARFLEQYGQTIARLQQARQQRPDDPEIAYQLGTVCQEAGMVDMATELYEQSLKSQPDFTKALEALAMVYAGMEKFSQAAQLLERLALLIPHEPMIYYNLARVYALDKKTEKAVNSLKAAVANGFNDIAYIRDDIALAAIRDTEYFRSLTSR